MQFITEKLFLYMLHHGVVEEKDSQIYRYGLQIAIEMNICIFTCVVVALFFKTIAESIFLTISFFFDKSIYKRISFETLFDMLYLFMHCDYWGKFICKLFYNKKSFITCVSISGVIFTSEIG